MRRPRRNPARKKDRDVSLALVYDEVDIRHVWTSQPPTEYALMLMVKRDGRWVTVCSADNSHEREDVDTHHLHRYVDGRPGPPESLPMVVQDANERHKIITWMADNWVELAA